MHAALAETDAWHFTKLTGDAKRVTRDAPTQAVELFRAGLALWRGTSLESDGTGTMWANWVRQLEEERLAAAEALYDACLRANLHDQIVGELEALCVEYPLRERFYDQLMVALYRCGRQAEALGVYERARRILAKELGLEPVPALTERMHEILAHSPSLLPRQPRVLITYPATENNGEDTTISGEQGEPIPPPPRRTARPGSAIDTDDREPSELEQLRRIVDELAREQNALNRAVGQLLRAQRFTGCQGRRDGCQWSRIAPS